MVSLLLKRKLEFEQKYDVQLSIMKRDSCVEITGSDEAAISATAGSIEALASAPRIDTSPAKIDLFCFAARTEDNIWRGVRANKWAVSIASEGAMKGRISKANRNFHIGSRGLFYCNATRSFTTPFIVESEIDPFTTIVDVWPEPWALSFTIRPLGNPETQLNSKLAILRWPILQRRAHKRNVFTAMNLTGTTVFVPIGITDEDWGLILSDLAFPRNGRAV